MRTLFGLSLIAACGSVPASTRPPAEEPQMPAPSPDFCARALELLGLDGGLLERCTPMLPDQYHVVATAGDRGYAGTVIVAGGVPDPERGCHAGAEWLRRIEVYRLAPNPVALVEGLEWLGALPEGFTAAHLTDHEDRTGATRFTANPFRLELRRVEAPTPAPGTEGLGGGRGRGGGAVPPQRRAVLTGDPDYRFTWTIERRDAGGPWQPVSTTPCD